MRQSKNSTIAQGRRFTGVIRATLEANTTHWRLSMGEEDWGDLVANKGVKSALDPYSKFGLIVGMIGVVETVLALNRGVRKSMGQVRFMTTKSQEQT